MGKYFGTDGIRGQYNSKLDVDLAFIIGKAAGSIFEVGDKICIGEDPRKSSQVIQCALASGLIASGVNVDSLGVTSTPNISHAIINNGYKAGIMISASHNPFTDNGIKFFGADGRKLSDQLEEKIEEIIDNGNFRLVETEQIGYLTQCDHLVEQYIQFLTSLGTDLTGINICLDCANGSAANIAPQVFSKLGATISTVGDQPNGININTQIGSTHPETISQMLKEGQFDYGFAYDGDADRIILLAGDGTILDGDYILYLLAKHLKASNELSNNIVITTVMANLGFVEGLEKLGIEVQKTDVGDRFVMQSIAQTDASLGGEQSGHIILPNHLPTGDGILVSVILAKIFATSNEDIKHQAQHMEKFPQVLINKHVNDKQKAMENPALLEQIAKYEQELGASGRILVRSSGTEELVRVMVEAKELETCNTICNQLMEFVN